MANGIPEFPQTLPARTVVGNLRTQSAIAEAIPIAAFAADLADASSITYTPAGAGAVSRTVQSKERDVVSVFDFMTAAQIADVQAGTALIDVGVAIAAAIAAVSVRGGTPYFPAGTYLFATGLTLPANVNLLGAGRLASILKYSGASIALDSNYVSSNASNGISYKEFQLACAASTIGIRFTNANDIFLSELDVNGGPSRTGNTTAAIQLSPPTGAQQVINFAVDHCNIHENVGFGIDALGSVNDLVNHISITNSNVRANGTNIHGLGENLGWLISGNNLEAGQTAAIALTDVQGLSIIGNYFEQTNAPAINLPATVDFNGVVIQGNFIGGSAANTAIILGAAGAAVKGVTVSGNVITGWTTGINPVRVVGGVIGPNRFVSCGSDIAAPGSSSASLLIQQEAGTWDFYGDTGSKNGRANLGIAQIIKTYTALSASDVDIGLGNSLLLNIRDTTNGGTASVLYENATTPVILGQAGATTFVTGAPAGGQIQVKNRGASGGVAVLANANRNNAVLNVSLVVTQP
jgi:hypothetical protein